MMDCFTNGYANWQTTILDEQILLYLSHGQTMPVMLMICCLLSVHLGNPRLLERHMVHHGTQSSGTELSDLGHRSHLFILTLTVSYFGIRLRQTHKQTKLCQDICSTHPHLAKVPAIITTQQQ